MPERSPPFTLSELTVCGFDEEIFQDGQEPAVAIHRTLPFADQPQYCVVWRFTESPTARGVQAVRWYVSKAEPNENLDGWPVYFELTDASHPYEHHWLTLVEAEAIVASANQILAWETGALSYSAVWSAPAPSALA